jgi:hypothetical protein
MMQAGKYYIGDLCYVMSDDDWNEVCELTTVGNKCIEGEFTLKDGRRFAMYGTRWGDGCYKDQYGNSYGVDSGTIGCILEEHINTYDWNKDLGTLAIFETDFVTGGGRGTPGWEGTIQFGRILIETDDDNWDEEDEEEDEEDNIERGYN